MKKIVVMASGEGSNFSAIVDSGIKVERVITNNTNANVIGRAKKAGVGSLLIEPKKEWHRDEYDKKIDYGIYHDFDLIVLAGWMRILSPWFCEKWADKIVNIHPSLLPAFGGSCHAIKDAWEHGCKVFGVTVHWVTEEVDTGPIIDQRSIHLFKDDTLEKITDKIHRVEHYVYPEVIKRLIGNENNQR